MSDVPGVNTQVGITARRIHSDLPEIDVVATPKDQTAVTKNAEGAYVASVVFPYQDNLKRNDIHGVTLDKISVYALGDQTVGTQGMMVLAKQSSGGEAAYTPLAEYTPESEQLNGVTSINRRTGQEVTTYSWFPAGTEAGQWRRGRP